MLLVQCAVLVKLANTTTSFRPNPLYYANADEVVNFILKFTATSQCGPGVLLPSGAKLDYLLACEGEFGYLEVSLEQSGFARLSFGKASVLQLNIAPGALCNDETALYLITAHPQANEPLELALLLRDRHGNAIMYLCSASAVYFALENSYSVSETELDASQRCIFTIVISSLAAAEIVRLSAWNYDKQIGSQISFPMSYGSSSLVWWNCVGATLMGGAALWLSWRIHRQNRRALAEDGALNAPSAGCTTMSTSL